jgi:hypothetical protein
MEKRIVLIVSLVAALLPQFLSAQDGIGNIRTESEVGRIYQLKPSLNWKPQSQPFTAHEKATGGGDPNPMPTIGNQAIDKAAATNAFIVNVGTNFEGNHLTGGTPSDNSLAISNNGLIVSVDNYSIAYFKENGDTITQFGLPLNKFYSDSTMDRDPFDPRVIFDSYDDRFILVSMFHSNDYKRSKLLLSFSKPLVADTVEWVHYQINCDSVFTAADERMFYFDYPNISVTKSQLIITSRIARRDTIAGTNALRTNVIFQIDKSKGYNALPVLGQKTWRKVENTENVSNINIVPAMDALQGLSSDTVVYLVGNYGDISTTFFWFELRGGPSSQTAQITPHGTFTSFYYSSPSYASQQGGLGRDRISVLDCDVQYALLQNNKMHFVFTRSNNGWGELVYANIDIGTNTFFSSTFDRVADQENLLRASIACFGADSTDENYLIGFLRTGPNQFPEICAMNYDSLGWGIVPTSVKTGHGILDLRSDLVAPWDSMERWGDYTCIQRRYSDPLKRCWMVGAHSFGLTANHFGRLSGVNAWIAELGDSLPALAATSPTAIESFILYPNPANASRIVTVEFPKMEVGQVKVIDAMGIVRHSAIVSGRLFVLATNELASGMYFVQVEIKGKNYETQKLVIRN